MSRRRTNPFDDMLNAWLDSIIAVPMVSTRYPQVNNVDDINIGTWDDANGHITATFDMPGVEKKDIDVKVEDHSITVKAENGGSRKYNYSRKFKPTVDIDSAVATFKNGVLDITLTKIEETSKGKSVKIK